ncbi:hypothetical protein KP509_18G008500 [Ceratopteris richardii]|uniref:Uncharacterized protein n=1 Tax=Ceratopteris richardii TaxID=49495 RepID=A0A8T2SPE3_CERRI|nr:hypothetical protein KP509_18G008500 [Ceratopteris richardii]
MTKTATIANFAYKSTVVFLGGCTAIFGANLLFNVYSGISWHLDHNSVKTSRYWK